MDIVCLDMEGVLVPEIWIAFAEATGIPELRRTTRDEPDYDKLMKYRLAILKEHGLGLKEIQDVIAGIDPLPGAKEFLDELRSITQVLTRRVSGRTPLVASTVATGVFADMVTGDQYLSIILTCNLYKDLYKEKGFESRLLSRSTEDSATVTSVLIPWNSCGMTQATVLKVPTLEYLPYCFFNLISPLMSILVAATGYRIYRLAKGPSASSERPEHR